MTLSISNKRTTDFSENSSKKLKEIPEHPLPHFIHTHHQKLPILLLINLSFVDKTILRIVDQIFSKQAQEIGLLRQDNNTAKKKWAELLTFMTHDCIIDFSKDLQFPLGKSNNTFSTCAEFFNSLHFEKINSILLTPGLYKKPTHPLLELLEFEGSWNCARKDIQEMFTPLPFLHLHGYLALSTAARKGKEALVNRLLELHVPPEGNQCTKGRKGQYILSPLNSAILSGDQKIVKTILQHLIEYKVKQGSEPAAIRNQLQENPLYTAFECALASSRVKEIEKKAQPNLEMLHFLLKQGFKPEARDLIAAAENSTVEVMRCLLEHGAILDKETASRALLALITHSIQSSPNDLDDHQKMMYSFLLNNGADYYFKDPETGDTLLDRVLKRSNSSWTRWHSSQNPIFIQWLRAQNLELKWLHAQNLERKQVDP